MNDSSTEYSKNIDLENCSKEAIHLIGKTQSYGVLVVCDPKSFEVTQAGTNVAEHFSVSHKELLGKPLSVLIGEKQVESLKASLVTQTNALPQEIVVGEKHFVLQAHFSQGNLLLDIEPVEQVHDPFFFQKQLTRVLNKIQESSSINELCDSVTVLAKEIFGYDRVMIYKFDENWNGQVLAESKEPEMESWLGLHYPASDIPAQSRALFLKHQVRMIANVHYTPVPIVPEISTSSGKPLDLSKSGLRAVSPIHIEYLINMNVGASLTAAIIVKGQLWGLIACHHRTPKFLSHYQRESSRFLAQMLSTEIALKESNSFIEKTAASERILNTLVDELNESNDDVIKALTKGPVKFTDLISCTGGAIFYEGDWKFLGKTPTRKKVETLMNKFLIHQKTGMYHTQNLSSVFAQSNDYKEVVSGLLSLRIAENKYLMWFRPEIKQTVSWGGDPDDKAFYDEEKKRISPRKSFKKWTNELTGMSKPWKDYDLSAARDLGDRVSHNLLEKQRQEISELNKKLLEVNKDLELFTSGLTHDLRAPIRGMDGYLQIIQEDFAGQLDKEGLKILKLARKLTVKMNSLIDDILSYSGLSGRENLRVQEIPVSKLLEEVLHIINAKSNYPNTAIEIEDNLPLMKGDKRMLFQLWLNIISNAFKYCAKVNCPEIVVGSTIKKGRQVYFVKDNGIGIDKKFSKKIFSTFTRVAGKEYSGSGIGLAIVKKIIEKHKGDIWVESELGKGTTFYFYTCPEF